MLGSSDGELWACRRRAHKQSALLYVHADMYHVADRMLTKTFRLDRCLQIASRCRSSGGIWIAGCVQVRRYGRTSSRVTGILAEQVAAGTNLPPPEGPLAKMSGYFSFFAIGAALRPSTLSFCKGGGMTFHAAGLAARVSASHPAFVFVLLWACR